MPDAGVRHRMTKAAWSYMLVQVGADRICRSLERRLSSGAAAEPEMVFRKRWENFLGVIVNECVGRGILCKMAKMFSLRTFENQPLLQSSALHVGGFHPWPNRKISFLNIPVLGPTPDRSN